MIIDDQDWIFEFRKFTFGTDVRSPEFLQKAHLGYQKFLFLKHRCSPLIEALGLAPCPSVDLMWHTHILHACVYRQDTKKHLGHSPKHKLLKVEDRTLTFMNDRDDAQLRLWREEFGESVFDYAVN
jgi:hypothetical protein